MIWLALCAFVVLFLTIIISYGCYRFAFYAAPKRERSDIEVPQGQAYEVFHDDMIRWIKEARMMQHEDVSIMSFDGLRLCGKFYEFAPGAPIELMFHGYRGTAERDLSGGVQRCFKLGRSALIVDQRCSKGSEGHVITFGINEHRDCMDWINFMVDYFGPDVKIILTGISMGAATVMMAAGHNLPANVIGVLADCGYNSAKDIIYKVIRQMRLPPAVCYPFVKLGARLFGRFNLEEYSPEEAMRNCTVPVIFFHGTQDDYVPCEMSRVNYDACVSRKKLVLIPGAGHGLSYPVAPDTYLSELRDFFGPGASYQGQPDCANFHV
jgi:dipeptidyl aminopeptidase/acylaminoacyl peptidase